jgi:FkbM family methyltransferase
VSSFRINPLTKHRLKKVAQALHIDTRGAKPGRTTTAQFCSHLSRLGYAPRSIIDVGVADGTFEIYTAFPDSRYLLVEPMIEFEPALRWIAAHYRADVALVAAGAEDGFSSIRFGSSISDLHGATLVNEAGQAAYTGNVRRITVRRLDGLAAEHRLEAPIMIKVDTQGTEFDVIAGAEGILPSVDIVILEATLYRFDQNLPLLHETLAFMAKLGFVAYDVFGAHNRPLDEALAWLDIAFVKRDGPFRRDERYIDGAAPVSAYRRTITAVRRILQV